MAKHFVIANPEAGHGRGNQLLPQVERLLTELSLDYDLARTTQPWHAAELARQAAGEGYDVVVAAGGDGTANEVLNGLIEFKNSTGSTPALGMIGLGRGNDFGHGAGVPGDVESACRVLAQGYRRPIDIGRVSGGLHPQGRYFGNCVGVGFDAIGTIEAAKLPRLGGFLSFFVAVLRTIFLYHRAPTSTVEYDGNTITQPSLMISIMNGQRLGGGFWMAPDSRPDDSVFDLCIVRQVSRRRILGLIPHFLRGTQATQPEVTTAQAKRISIHSTEGPLPAQTDGEIISVKGQSLDIELLPLQLEVICAPPGGAE